MSKHDTSRHKTRHSKLRRSSDPVLKTFNKSIASTKTLNEINKTATSSGQSSQKVKVNNQKCTIANTSNNLNPSPSNDTHKVAYIENKNYDRQNVIESKSNILVKISQVQMEVTFKNNEYSCYCSDYDTRHPNNQDLEENSMDYKEPIIQNIDKNLTKTKSNKPCSEISNSESRREKKSVSISNTQTVHSSELSNNFETNINDAEIEEATIDYEHASLRTINNNSIKSTLLWTNNISRKNSESGYEPLLPCRSVFDIRSDNLRSISTETVNAYKPESNVHNKDYSMKANTNQSYNSSRIESDKDDGPRTKRTSFVITDITDITDDTSVQASDLYNGETNIAEVRQSSKCLGNKQSADNTVEKVKPVFRHVTKVVTEKSRPKTRTTCNIVTNDVRIKIDKKHNNKKSSASFTIIKKPIDARVTESCDCINQEEVGEYRNQKQNLDKDTLTISNSAEENVESDSKRILKVNAIENKTGKSHKYLNVLLDLVQTLLNILPTSNNQSSNQNDDIINGMCSTKDNIKVHLMKLFVALEKYKCIIEEKGQNAQNAQNAHADREQQQETEFTQLNCNQYNSIRYIQYRNRIHPVSTLSKSPSSLQENKHALKRTCYKEDNMKLVLKELFKTLEKYNCFKESVDQNEQENNNQHKIEHTNTNSILHSSESPTRYNTCIPPAFTLSNKLSLKKNENDESVERLNHTEGIMEIANEILDDSDKCNSRTVNVVIEQKTEYPENHDGSSSLEYGNSKEYECVCLLDLFQTISNMLETFNTNDNDDALETMCYTKDNMKLVVKKLLQALEKYKCLIEDKGQNTYADDEQQKTEQQGVQKGGMQMTSTTYIQYRNRVHPVSTLSSSTSNPHALERMCHKKEHMKLMLKRLLKGLENYKCFTQDKCPNSPFTSKENKCDDALKTCNCLEENVKSISERTLKGLNLCEKRKISGNQLSPGNEIECKNCSSSSNIQKNSYKNKDYDMLEKCKLTVDNGDEISNATLEKSHEVLLKNKDENSQPVNVGDHKRKHPQKSVQHLCSGCPCQTDLQNEHLETYNNQLSTASQTEDNPSSSKDNKNYMQSSSTSNIHNHYSSKELKTEDENNNDQLMIVWTGKQTEVTNEPNDADILSDELQKSLPEEGSPKSVIHEIENDNIEQNDLLSMDFTSTRRQTNVNDKEDHDKANDINQSSEYPERFDNELSPMVDTLSDNPRKGSPSSSLNNETVDDSLKKTESVENLNDEILSQELDNCKEIYDKYMLLNKEQELSLPEKINKEDHSERHNNKILQEKKKHNSHKHRKDQNSSHSNDPNTEYDSLDRLELRGQNANAVLKRLLEDKYALGGARVISDENKHDILKKVNDKGSITLIEKDQLIAFIQSPNSNNVSNTLNGKNKEVNTLPSVTKNEAVDTKDLQNMSKVDCAVEEDILLSSLKKVTKETKIEKKKVPPLQSLIIETRAAASISSISSTKGGYCGLCCLSKKKSPGELTYINPAVQSNRVSQGFDTEDGRLINRGDVLTSTKQDMIKDYDPIKMSFVKEDVADSTHTRHSVQPSQLKPTIEAPAVPDAPVTPVPLTQGNTIVQQIMPRRQSVDGTRVLEAVTVAKMQNSDILTDVPVEVNGVQIENMNDQQLSKLRKSTGVDLGSRIQLQEIRMSNNPVFSNMVNEIKKNQIEEIIRQKSSFSVARSDDGKEAARQMLQVLGLDLEDSEHDVMSKKSSKSEHLIVDPEEQSTSSGQNKYYSKVEKRRKLEFLES